MAKNVWGPWKGYSGNCVTCQLVPPMPRMTLAISPPLGALVRNENTDTNLG